MLLEETKEEEVLEEEPLEADEETETKEEESEEIEEAKEEEDSSKKVIDALRKENDRLKADRRERKIESTFSVKEEEEETKITRAEARLFESWRSEELENFLSTHPQYRDNEDLWSDFVKEYEDRLPEIQYAEKRKIPITKQLFKDRMNSIHRSLGLETDKAKEEGKKELLKAQSSASVYSSGSGAGEKTQTVTKTKYSAREQEFLSRYGVKL